MSLNIKITMKKLFKYLFLIILVLFSLGQLQRIQLNEVMTFYAHDIFIAIWLVLIALKHRQRMLTLIKKYFFNYLTYSLIIWIILGLVINFISHNFSIIPLLYIARAITYLLFALSLPLALTYSSKSYNRYWVLVGLFIAISGILQYLLFPDTRFLKYLGWDDHYFRLIGTQLDPNFTGILLTITFLITQGVWDKQNRVKTCLSILLTGAILLTYSRASFLSFIIGSALIIFIGFIKSHQKNISLSIIMGLFIILIPLLPRPDGEGVKLERTASISARIKSNQLSLKNLNKYEWFWGKGLFVYQAQPQEKSFWPNTAHFSNNLIVFLFTSMGVIGLGLSLIILYKVGEYLYEKDMYIFIAFIAILIHSQFNHTLFQPFVWLWITNQILTIEITKT
jgi:O-antigen ligase/polysaccharide polymerase Wzy-like membrane protein